MFTVELISTEDKMKKLFLLAAIFFLIGFTATQAKPANPPAGFGVFFSVLSPHGSWIELNDGLVVWRPTIMRRGWAPYSEGRWVWTNDGWYWDSYEPYGDVVYHYGRWYFDDYYGWIWVPDYEWAPSWVEWRYDDEYIGWAPLPPYAIFSINIGVHYTYDYYTPYTCWHFTSYRYFDDPYVNRHFVGPKYRHNIYNRTKYRTNYDYYDGRVVNRGVDVDFVRQRSGREIRTRDIERVRDINQFGGNRERGKNERIRTLYVPKDDLRNEKDFDRKDIKRSDRKSSLDIAKLELGDRRDQKRDDRTREVVTREEKKDTREVIRDNSNGRNDRTQVEKRNEIKVEDRRNENIRKETENKNREQNERMINKRNEDTQRQNKIEMQKRNDEKIQMEKRNQENKTNRNNDTRIQRNDNNDKREVKRTETRNEVKRNDTRTERNNSGNDRNKIERKVR